MLEELIGNKHFRRTFPPVAAVGLIALFLSLGLWQLDRAAGKNRVRALFEDDAPLTQLTGDMPVTEFEPLLIVNRGWIARRGANQPDADISVAGNNRSIRGRVGHLPRVGIRSAEAFVGAGGWPRRAIYPTLEELSAELNEELLPFVLLLGPEADDGYVRRWQPRESGPMMHYGYAFQWFAMAAAVLGILAWRMRKKQA
jgi:surfeit locus 1 family protein